MLNARTKIAYLNFNQHIEEGKLTHTSLTELDNLIFINLTIVTVKT